MLGYDYGNKVEADESSVSITGKKCLNEDKSFWNDSIMIKNYIQVRPFLNQNQSLIYPFSVF